ncbi:hypothetical protein [Apilactobacillus quenuiae]|uniref:hypothetical protein n=1 Tax=Apilactobacillus quenuiae TaxID=2008377 RepID=UPI00130000D8|nr:hypothetical protein [Apilactobacillus quenuiae]
MYDNGNPFYAITPDVYNTLTSYCSKYVYLSFYKGATSKISSGWSDPWSKVLGLTADITNAYNVIRPHVLTKYFSKDFKLTCLHQITSYD